MGSTFGELYSAARMLFPAMLVLSTLVAGCVLWWRLVSAPILVTKPLWPRFEARPALSPRSPQPTMRPWLWCSAPEESPYRRRRLVTVLFVAVWGLGTVGVLLGNLDSSTVEPPTARIVLYNLWGTFFVGVAAMVLADIAVAGCAFVATVRDGGGVYGFHKRWRPVITSWHRAAAVGAMWLLFTVLGLRSGYYWGSTVPAPRSIEIPMRNLPACLDGYRVGMISDVHAGPMVGRAEVQLLADWAAHASLDVLLLDGDFADGRPELVGKLIEPLAELSAGEDGRRPPDGLWFVTGNHEYLHGASGAMWMQWWSQRGVKVLYNNHSTLPSSSHATARGCTANETWTLAGVPDFWMDTPRLEEALAGVRASSAVLLMAHQPNQAKKAAASGQVQVQLSGHTHGGQTWPLTTGVYLQNTYLAGLYRRQDMYVYVSEGAIGWGERVRFWSSPEITLVTLRSGYGQPSGDIGRRSCMYGAWFGLLIFPIYFLLWAVVCCWGKRWRTIKSGVSSEDGELLLSKRPP